MHDPVSPTWPATPQAWRCSSCASRTGSPWPDPEPQRFGSRATAQRSPSERSWPAEHPMPASFLCWVRLQHATTQHAGGCPSGRCSPVLSLSRHMHVSYEPLSWPRNEVRLASSIVPSTSALRRCQWREALWREDSAQLGHSQLQAQGPLPHSPACPMPETSIKPSAYLVTETVMPSHSSSHPL